MLPVCPGWMPTPVADLLNKPLMTLSRARNGLSGSRLLESSISAPLPFALQFLGLMPLPMNSAANRFGGSAFSAPRAPSGNASSHGSATVTPTPRRTVRREGRRSEDGMIAWQVEAGGFRGVVYHQRGR